MGTNAEFNLRFTKKMIEKEASVAEKKYETSRKKALDALKKTSDIETARIYAETAVQNRTAHNQFLLMASRIDSVIAKVKYFFKNKIIKLYFYVGSTSQCTKCNG